jgi:excisionase family DNA binding protein
MAQSVCAMLITTSRAAKILQTSEGTVRALERRGELPAERTSSGLRLFDRAVVERIARERAERHKVTPSPEAA